MPLLRNNQIRLSLVVVIALGWFSCRWGYQLVSIDELPNGAGGGNGSGGEAGTGGEVGEGGYIPMAPDEWWNDSYASRSRIDLNNEDLGETLTDFPVAVHLNRTTIDYEKPAPWGNQSVL